MKMRAKGLLLYFLLVVGEGLPCRQMGQLGGGGTASLDSERELD